MCQPSSGLMHSRPVSHERGGVQKARRAFHRSYHQSCVSGFWSVLVLAVTAEELMKLRCAAPKQQHLSRRPPEMAGRLNESRCGT